MCNHFSSSSPVSRSDSLLSVRNSARAIDMYTGASCGLTTTSVVTTDRLSEGNVSWNASPRQILTNRAARRALPISRHTIASSVLVVRISMPCGCLHFSPLSSCCTSGTSCGRSLFMNSSSDFCTRSMKATSLFRNRSLYVAGDEPIFVPTSSAPVPHAATRTTSHFSTERKCIGTKLLSGAFCGCRAHSDARNTGALPTSSNISVTVTFFVLACFTQSSATTDSHSFRRNRCVISSRDLLTLASVCGLVDVGVGLRFS
mmetsp:Transcript_78080/g.91158  ORF Transcript_78080/g.91158 Transcript_78080/m.91158 type:complete len:259 (-) Transcript_78080:447-1223(-)